jgi:RimJ/RimL family protein N-acetyltransferase
MIAREWSLDDVDGAWAMYRLPEVVQYIGGEVQETRDAAREKLEFLIARNASWDEGFGSFPLFRKTDGRLIGTAIFKVLPDENGEPSGDVEIGWHLHPDVWGNGYATEAGRALIEYGFGTMGLSVLHAVVEPPNTASCAVARRLGMKHIGRTTRYYSGLEVEHFVLEKE